MDLDDILEADACDRATVSKLVDRLRGSRTPEQLIYRETELDELWRLVEAAVRQTAEPGARERLTRLRDAVEAAHDLVGVEQRPEAAAARLQEALIAGLAD